MIKKIHSMVFPYLFSMMEPFTRATIMMGNFVESGMNFIPTEIPILVCSREV
jgi:hypothetical protein